MKFSSAAAMAILGASSVLAAPQTAAAAAPTTFPADIQTQIQTLQGNIQNAIKDFAQGVDSTTTARDYSSTGRSLDFFLRNNFLPAGPAACPQAGTPLPPQAKTSDQAIGYLQQAQLALIAVSQDAINSNFNQGLFDACTVVRQYGGAAISR